MAHGDKDKRIDNLERRLALALEEIARLEEELHLAKAVVHYTHEFAGQLQARADAPLYGGTGHQ